MATVRFTEKGTKEYDLIATVPGDGDAIYVYSWKDKNHQERLGASYAKYMTKTD